MKEKPVVLLIPNNSWWILGKMAREIESALSDRFQFVRISEIVFEWRPQLLASILECVDAVHCLNESSAVMLKQASPRVPVCTWIHHVTEWSEQHQAACEISDSLTACTDGWNEYISGRCKGKPVYTIRHGVDRAIFKPISGARKQCGFQDSDFVVGFFGSKGSDSDNNRKGIDVFIASLKRAAARIPELKGIIAGPGWGEVVQELKAGGLAISYLGVVSDSQLPVIYSALDVYMVTARIEGGPCTVLESMACGTPVIATRVGLVPEVIADWKNGVSVPVDDVDGMSEALIRYSSSSADSRQHISENARETALKKPWNKVLQPLAGVYEELLRDKKRAPKRTRQPIDKISDLATRVEHLCTIRGKASSSIMHYMPLLQPNELALTWKALRLLKAPSPEF